MRRAAAFVVIPVCAAVVFGFPAASTQPEPPPREPATGQDVGAREIGNALAAVLLGEALEAAHARYATLAQPVPRRVREKLVAHFEEELTRARYVVSEVPIALPVVVHDFMGTKQREGVSAVTIDDVIVFTEPPSLERDLWLWAHELHHVSQYRELGGIDGFAKRYLENCTGLEVAADRRANRALGKNHRPPHCL